MSNNTAKPNNLAVEGAKFYFKNFRGAQTDFSPAGKRSFGIFIDPEMAEQLANDGWNVKYTKPTPDRESVPYMQIEARFDNFPPKIVMMTESGGKTLVTEETVAMLDTAEIISCDLIATPYYWTLPSGVSGIKAYLHTMYVTIQEDRFAAKYGEI